MKIAVATENNDHSARICTLGARAFFFLVFDKDGVLSEILENSYASNVRHVGLDVANMLIDLHVTKVIAGRFGSKFKNSLENNHVECIEQAGFASQVVKELIK